MSSFDMNSFIDLPIVPTCIDLILTNKENHLLKTAIFETGQSDQRKLSTIKLRNTFSKGNSRHAKLGKPQNWGLQPKPLEILEIQQKSWRFQQYFFSLTIKPHLDSQTTLTAKLLARSSYSTFATRLPERSCHIFVCFQFFLHRKIKWLQ